MKTILGVLSAPRQHWVGDGFPVRSLFSFDTLDGHLNPFLLLDYAGPAEFAPTEHQRGVGQHPHRGFETVTIVYEGEVAHRDSTGNGGVIGPGDVQWMTAASGILHEEFHAPEFSKKGGAFEMVQLWINLPAKDKMAPPGYQGIVNKDIPVVSLADNAGTMRVIAGQFEGAQGPAHTFTPINVWDVRLHQGSTTTLPIPTGHVAAVVVLHGTILVNGAEVAREAQVVLLDRDGDSVLLEANSDATLLLLSGAPLDEPVFAHGPFVMNTREEIVTAMQDFNSGRFGEIAPATS
ncbi:pirin family protein [Glaciimonas sp. Gout2]|uniref:pirin family protein n=1 Tax=unclassified Glaciimonas TaxID=2644401 RepID=UPI002B23018B|nr:MULTISPECIES: pirin family protein [unclassified Glaciimonas]MEB0012235.1 pirin family protein [Glaciimonas sp. Cout2]MEB0082418.1 pirin family protein [Glaciimonas sp. Gout2]